MIALLAALALLAGPVMAILPMRRVARRARTLPPGPVPRERIRELVTSGEATCSGAGMLLFAAGVLVLGVMAVLG